ncbi:MAG: hypothetical protein LBT40_04870 [Deltaproteobacteria bacterium]|jgi:hypothetical protein|nr:hypothetical protein [Deltaproteobacteria bacterium]
MNRRKGIMDWIKGFLDRYLFTDESRGEPTVGLRSSSFLVQGGLPPCQ